MSHQEKNITASLVTFTLILAYYLIRLMNMIQTGGLVLTKLFRLWGIIIVLGIIGTIVTTIFTHIIAAIVQAIQTGEEDPKIEDIEDERDKLIDLKGTRIAYVASSFGVFLAMLAFVFGQPALVMFSLLIFFGLFAQIVGDVSRLVLYRRGF
jgi:hypothetical protein